MNWFPTPVLNNRTSYEMFFKIKPTYQHIKTFRCLCYVSTLIQGRKKFDPKEKACVFVGHPCKVKGYKVLELDRKYITISRDVIFCENTFPFQTK